MTVHFRVPIHHEIFRCSECDKKKRYRYVPWLDVCRKCGSKNRSCWSNEMVQITDELVVTTIVGKRLHERAEKVALREREPLEPKIEMLQTVQGLASFILGPMLIMMLILVGYGAWEISLFFLGCSVFVGGMVYAIDRRIKEPLAARDAKWAEQVHQKTIELAQERAEQMIDRELFYSSAEWKALRNQVIREDGKFCAECGYHIYYSDDLTVDHIKPRSRFPELALKRDNLQVLCRSCNSSKGDRDAPSPLSLTVENRRRYNRR